MSRTMVIVDELGGEPERPVSRHVAVPVSSGATLGLETTTGNVTIPCPMPPTSAERAMLRERHPFKDWGFSFSRIEDVLERLLLGDVAWDQAVRVTRTLGAFRLPPTLSVPWVSRELEVHELQAYEFVDVGDTILLNLLLTASTTKEQMQVALAPSGLVEEIERSELEALAKAGDAAFDEIERG